MNATNGSPATKPKSNAIEIARRFNAFGPLTAALETLRVAMDSLSGPILVRAQTDYAAARAMIEASPVR